MLEAQDHYLLAWVLTHGGRWCPWEPTGPIAGYPGPFDRLGIYGQVHFRGEIYLSRLSKMGVPIITKRLRQAALADIEEARMRT